MATFGNLNVQNTGNVQQAFGDNATFTQNNAETGLDINKLFELMIADAPEVKESLEAIKTESEKDEPKIEAVKADVEKVQTVGEKLGSTLGKVGFGLAKGLLMSNPITATIVTIAEEFQKE